MTNVMHKLFSMYLFPTLYMFRAHRAHHQGRQIVSIQPLVTVYVGGRDVCTHHGHQHRLLPEAVLIQFVSPDDEHDVLETCRELEINT